MFLFTFVVEKLTSIVVYTAKEKALVSVQQLLLEGGKLSYSPLMVHYPYTTAMQNYITYNIPTFHNFFFAHCANCSRLTILLICLTFIHHDLFTSTLGFKKRNHTITTMITKISKHSKKKTILVTKLVSSTCFLLRRSRISCCRASCSFICSRTRQDEARYP